MRRIPREIFSIGYPPHLYNTDVALPIGCGQTMSRPSTVATVLSSLGLEPHHRVLEIGTGSGYQTAILSGLCKEVWSIERAEPLLTRAMASLTRLGRLNVVALLGDGRQGWPAAAPFDRIVVCCALRGTPRTLLGQLKPSGNAIWPEFQRRARGQQLILAQKLLSGEIVLSALGSSDFVCVEGGLWGA